MTVVLAICVAMLAVAAVLLVVRVTIGPTMLDRAVALDALVAVTIGALIIEAAVNRHTTTLPVLVVLTLVGFVGSVSIARFTRGSADVEEDHS
jgi:multicomponent Na+:H+ antiporter subunit F